MGQRIDKLRRSFEAVKKTAKATPTLAATAIVAMVYATVRCLCHIVHMIVFRKDH